MISTISLIFTFVILYTSFILTILYIVTGRKIKMDYKLALRNLFEMVEIVLYCIFTIIYTLASCIVFTSTWAIDKIDGIDADYTIDLELFGRKMHLTTKK